MEKKEVSKPKSHLREWVIPGHIQERITETYIKGWLQHDCI
jgi:hypothetical protein